MANKPGQSFTRQAAEPPVVARNINQGLPLLEALDRMGFGRGTAVQWLPGGIPLVWSTIPDLAIRPVRAPSTGIPAKSGNTPGQGTCTLYTWNGTAHVVGTDTVVVRNDYGTAVGANKLIKIHYWQGEWWVLTESC